jgi:hypothetical protein
MDKDSKPLEDTLRKRVQRLGLHKVPSAIKLIDRKIKNLDVETDMTKINRLLDLRRDLHARIENNDNGG